MQKVEVLLIDDTDGSEATETIKFSLGNDTYEIDLSERNANALKKSLSRYVDHARKVVIPTKHKSRANRELIQIESNAIRTWAKARGYKISDRGRIPRNIEAEYRAHT